MQINSDIEEEFSRKWHCGTCSTLNHFNSNYDCKISLFFDIFGRKHTLNIVRILLSNEKMRFKDIQNELSLNSKTLSLRLKELEEHNLINRNYIQGIPPHVDYSISQNGENLILIFESIQSYFY